MRTLGCASYSDAYTALVSSRRFDDGPVALRADIVIRRQRGPGLDFVYGAKCLSEAKGGYWTNSAFGVRFQERVCSPPWAG